MNWPTPSTRRAFKLGDKRTVSRFAWVPVRLVEGQTVWLERYWSVEEYRERFDGMVWPGGEMVYRWLQMYATQQAMF